MQVTQAGRYRTSSYASIVERRCLWLRSARRTCIRHASRTTRYSFSLSLLIVPSARMEARLFPRKVNKPVMHARPVWKVFSQTAQHLWSHCFVSTFKFFSTFVHFAFRNISFAFDYHSSKNSSSLKLRTDPVKCVTHGQLNIKCLHFIAKVYSRQ